MPGFKHSNLGAKNGIDSESVLNLRWLFEKNGLFSCKTLLSGDTADFSKSFLVQKNIVFINIHKPFINNIRYRSNALKICPKTTQALSRISSFEKYKDAVKFKTHMAFFSHKVDENSILVEKKYPIQT